MSYHATLVQYYEEEVEGEAYFAELAKRFEDPAHREKLTLLAEVERHAAEAVAPLIEKYGLIPKQSEALVESGRADAQSTAADWDKLIAGMNATYTGYLNDFKNLETMGPAEDQQRLTFLTEHEVAAIRFLDLEANDPAASAAPLRAYLAASPENWSPHAA
ncbi:MAG: hypothetical protein AAGF56_05115 [Pseudomonadota bacterium]